MGHTLGIERGGHLLFLPYQCVADLLTQRTKIRSQLFFQYLKKNFVFSTGVIEKCNLHNDVNQQKKILRVLRHCDCLFTPCVGYFLTFCMEIYFFCTNNLYIRPACKSLITFVAWKGVGVEWKEPCGGGGIKMCTYHEC